MIYPDIPHMAFPFAVHSGAVAATDQDSEEDVFACVTLIASIPEGSVLELPTMGVPDLAFSQQPTDPQAVVKAILAQEPRATVDVIENLTVPDTASFTFDVGVNTDSETRNG